MIGGSKKVWVDALCLDVRRWFCQCCRNGGLKCKPRAVGALAKPVAHLLLNVVILFSGSFVIAAPPDLSYFFPSGAKRGQTVTVTAAGKASNGALRVWVAGKGVEFEPAKDPRSFNVKVTANAVPGVRLVRLINDEGASPCYPLVIGTLDELLEQEPNDALEAPQRISAAATVINGRLQKGGDVDSFGVELSAGQTLVASIDAHELLGSPMDGVLQLVDTAGNVLAQNHDDHGLDPRLVFTAPRAGQYVVRVFAFPAVATGSINFAGGEKFVYRLTLTRGGFLDYAFPLAVKADESREVELVGWNIPTGARKQTLSALTAGEVQTVFDPLLAGTATVAVVPHAVIAEIEPNEAQPQAIEVPATISGRIEKPGDVDAFAFAAKKGQRLMLRAASRRLGYPLDPALRILDEHGKQLAQADDVTGGRDAELAFKVPADGRYQVNVSDFTGQGSSRHIYRLDILPAEPEFELKLAAENLAIPQGKPAELAIEIDRRNGFAEEISFEVRDLPRGITIEPVKSLGKGDSAKTVRLRFSAAKDAASGAVRIVGKSKDDGLQTATAPVGDLSIRISDVWLAAVGEGTKPNDESPKPKEEKKKSKKEK
jgi:hypothetical protein